MLPVFPRSFFEVDDGHDRVCYFRHAPDEILEIKLETMSVTTYFGTNT